MALGFSTRSNLPLVDFNTVRGELQVILEDLEGYLTAPDHGVGALGPGQSASILLALEEPLEHSTQDVGMRKCLCANGVLRGFPGTCPCTFGGLGHWGRRDDLLLRPVPLYGQRGSWQGAIDTFELLRADDFAAADVVFFLGVDA